MSLKIIHPGFLTIPVDRGRFGKMAEGFCHSGPADQIAFHWNAALLGNSSAEAQLEIYRGKLSLVSQKPCTVAFTGRGCDIFLNGRLKPAWSVYDIEKGDRLMFEPNGSGDFAYLGIKGGFVFDVLFGSRSACPRMGIGKLPESGELLESYPVQDNGSPGSSILSKSSFGNLSVYGLKRSMIPVNKNSPAVCRFFPGLQYEDFPEESQELFITSRYTIGNRKSRMGIRMDGPEIKWTGKELYSEGLRPGTIQIPPDGQPIVLGPDAQTIGGYPKIGTLFSLDLATLYRLPAGENIYFKPISPTEAAAELQQFQDQLREYCPEYSLS